MCIDTIYPCSHSSVGSLILVIFYGCVLGLGAKLISDGAEGVLDLWPNYGSVIGALLLPVLGALPDSAMIVVSGAFGTVAEAQVQVGVGVGTLAGSTIMLLTVPWSASLFMAACDLNDLGESIEQRRTYWSLTRTGITVDHDTKINARIMLASSLAFFIVQGIAFHYVQPIVDTSSAARAAEYPWALAGFAICSAGLVGYCVYQIFVPHIAQKRVEQMQKDRHERNAKLRALYILHHFPEITDVLHNSNPVEKLHADALSFARHWKHAALHPETSLSVSSINNGDEVEPLLLSDPNDAGSEAGSDEETGEENPRDHFGKNLAIAMALMIGGTAIVAVFSDPMVEVITTLAYLWTIPPFYISFVLTPFCSNASELVASLAFASRKKIANTSMTYSQIYGAVVMNNTMGLGIFFAIVAFRGLAWTFTAETLSILFAILAVGIPAAFLTNFKLYWVFLNAPVYFLSIGLVYLLEHELSWA